MKIFGRFFGIVIVVIALVIVVVTTPAFLGVPRGAVIRFFLAPAFFLVAGRAMVGFLAIIVADFHLDLGAHGFAGGKQGQGYTYHENSA